MERKEGIIISIIVLILVLLAYATGYGKGAMDSFTLIAENVESMIDMQLSPQAKAILQSQPKLLGLIFTPATLDKFFRDKGASYLPTWSECPEVNYTYFNISERGLKNNG